MTIYELRHATLADLYRETMRIDEQVWPTIKPGSVMERVVARYQTALERMIDCELFSLGGHHETRDEVIADYQAQLQDGNRAWARNQGAEWAQ